MPPRRAHAGGACGPARARHSAFSCAARPRALPAQDKAAMQQNLQQLARGAQWLVLWLDCDREGENIGCARAACACPGAHGGAAERYTGRTHARAPSVSAGAVAGQLPGALSHLPSPRHGPTRFEVLRVCSQANPRLTVKRARFSALIPRCARPRAPLRCCWTQHQPQTGVWVCASTP